MRASLIELTRGTDSSDAAAVSGGAVIFQSLGKHTPVGRTTRPGWCSDGSSARSSTRPRSRWARGWAAPQDIDAGMVHGLNYPRGILAWADEIGLDHVLAVLDALAAGARRGALSCRRRCCAASAWSGRLGPRHRRGLLQLRRLICRAASAVAGSGPRGRAAQSFVRPMHEECASFVIRCAFSGSRQPVEMTVGEILACPSWTFVREPIWTYD